MKILDILNNIVNEKEVPNRIIHDGKIYNFEDHYDYFNPDYGYLFDRYNVVDILNDEVEVLEENKIDNFTGLKIYKDGIVISSMDWTEEEKKIPGKLNLDTYATIGTEVDKDVIIKINEIIDYLKSKGE